MRIVPRAGKTSCARFLSVCVHATQSSDPGRLGARGRVSPHEHTPRRVRNEYISRDRECAFTEIHRPRDGNNAPQCTRMNEVKGCCTRVASFIHRPFNPFGTRPDPASRTCSGVTSARALNHHHDPGGRARAAEPVCTVDRVQQIIRITIGVTLAIVRSERP